MSLIEQKEPESAPEQEKPPFLYHGSTHKDVGELEPRSKKQRDPQEGRAVFATQELSLATVFMAEVGNCGLFWDIPYAVIPGTREDFIKRDKGGQVYVVSSEGFQCDPAKGLGRYEWKNEEKVKPVKTLEYKSALDAMIESGVQVYFVDAKTLADIKDSKDHGWAILNKLESENQRRGINIRIPTSQKNQDVR